MQKGIEFGSVDAVRLTGASYPQIWRWTNYFFGEGNGTRYYRDITRNEVRGLWFLGRMCPAGERANRVYMSTVIRELIGDIVCRDPDDATIYFIGKDQWRAVPLEPENVEAERRQVALAHEELSKLGCTAMTVVTVPSFDQISSAVAKVNVFDGADERT